MILGRRLRLSGETYHMYKHLGVVFGFYRIKMPLSSSAKGELYNWLRTKINLGRRQ